MSIESKAKRTNWGGAVWPWARQTTFSRKIKYMLHECCTPLHDSIQIAESRCHASLL